MKNTKPRSRTPAIDRRTFIRLGAAAAAATGLGDRRASAQTKPSRPVSIDMHTHWAPEAYTKILSKMRRGGNPVSGNPLNYDLDKRRQWMDDHGVQMHVLTLNGGMPWQWIPMDVGATVARIVNDAAIEAHKRYPDRFVAGIEVSIRSPELALRELNRVAGNPAMRAVHLPNSMEGNDYLFEERYGPFLARCEELGYPLLFHPLDGDENIYGGAEDSRIAVPRAREANLNNTLGFPFEHGTTAVKFIITGTLDKYPKLQIVLPHSGGIFPYIAGRIHYGLYSMKFKLQRPFREYVDRFHYDTLTYYPETMRFLIDLVGADRIVIGTDNFATMDVEWPNQLVEQMKLSDADREKILRGNAARLLRL
jgi:aminocarboxymuconate-semialdehyde decarboxylase